MNINEIEKHYQKQAEEFIDVLFDNNLFRKDFSRDEMRKVEELLAFYLQNNAKTSKKIAEWEAKNKKPLQN